MIYGHLNKHLQRVVVVPIHLMVWVIGFIKHGYKDEEGRGMFNDIKLHWSVHLNGDESWRDEQDELLGLQGGGTRM